MNQPALASDEVTYPLAEIEALDRKWTDAFARRHGWEEHFLTDPVDDLKVFADHVPGMRMLDVGCGWARYVRLFLGAGFTYTGLDNSQEMLKVARENHPQLPFVHAPASAMPLPDASFDALWSCCVLSYMPKAHVTSVLSEHLRVLVPGGVLMMVLPCPFDSYEDMSYDDDGNPELYYAYYFLEEFEEYVRAAGFEIVIGDYRPQNGSMYLLAKRPAE